MESIDLNRVSKKLFKLITGFQKKAFNQDELIKCFPLPPSNVKVMFYLIHNGSDTVSNIGKTLNISKPNMTPIIDKLFNDGFVRRFEDPKDRRKIRIEITEKGHNFLHEKRKQLLNNFSDKISVLPSEDIIKLEESLNTLNSIISKL